MRWLVNSWRGAFAPMPRLAASEAGPIVATILFCRAIVALQIAVIAGAALLAYPFLG